MSREIRRKAIGMFVVEILFLVLLGALLFTMQTNLSLKSQRESSHEKLKEIDSIRETERNRQHPGAGSPGRGVNYPVL